MPQELDAIQKIMGAFGKYQLYVTLLIFLVKFFIPLNQMSIIFLAPKVTFTCGPNKEKMKCPCSDPEFDKSIFTRTIAMKWNLICEKKWLVNFTQTLFQLGTLVGSVIFGIASDRFGRRMPLIVAVILQLVAGVAAAFVPHYWMFNTMRFIVGCADGGAMVISFVIIMEFIGAQYRYIVAALYQVPFNIGHMILPLIGYFIRDYADFQLMISVPSVILLSYFILLPETPRWLIAMKKTDKAIKCLEKVATMNKLPTSNISSDVLAYQAAIEAAQKNKVAEGNVTDLFRTPVLRRNIICMAMNWLACSYCFYGVAQYVSHLTGNIFMNVLASAALGLTGSLLSIPLMKVMGRKTILISQNFMAVICLILLSVVPSGQFSVVLAAIIVMSSFIVFVLAYLFCGELFPTVVRNAALGFSSMLARVGSMIAPFVTDTAEVGKWLPPLLFAIFPVIGGCLAFLLPETKGRELLTTVEEAETRGRAEAANKNNSRVFPSLKKT